MILSIIIPVYNEERTVEDIVGQVAGIRLPYDMKKEIIVIDDSSTDSSYSLIEKLELKYKGIKSMKNEKNLGKSTTVKKGILNSAGDYIIIQDADLEYDPTEISEMVDFILKNDLDVVYGNRFGKKSKIIYWYNYLGNKFVSFVSNLFTFSRIKVWLPDMEVCYKLIRGNVARDIARNLKSISNFGFEPEMTARLSKYKKNTKHLKFGVIPISYNPRTLEEGKHMRAFKDGIKALFEIIRYNVLRK